MKFKLDRWGETQRLVYQARILMQLDAHTHQQNYLVFNQVALLLLYQQLSEQVAFYYLRHLHHQGEWSLKDCQAKLI